MSVLKMQTIHFSTSIMAERSWGSLVGFLNSFPVNATSLTVPSLNCGFLTLSGNIDVSSENANHTFFCIHHVRKKLGISGGFSKFISSKCNLFNCSII